MNKKPRRAPLRLIKDALRHYSVAASDSINSNTASKAHWTAMLLSYVPGMVEELGERRARNRRHK